MAVPTPFLEFLPGGITTGPVTWPNTGSGGSSFNLDTVIGTTPSDISRVTDSVTGNRMVQNTDASGNDDAALGTSSSQAITSTAFTVVLFMVVDDAGVSMNVFDSFATTDRKRFFYQATPPQWRTGSGSPFKEQGFVPSRVAVGIRMDSVGSLIDMRLQNEFGQGMDQRDDPISVTADWDFGTILNRSTGGRAFIGSIGELRAWDSKLGDADYDEVFNEVFNTWVNPALIRMLPENILTGGFWDNDVSGTGGASYDLDTKVGTAATITRTTDSETGFNLCTGSTAANCTLKSTVTNLNISNPITLIMFVIFNHADMETVGGAATFFDSRDSGDNNFRQFLFFNTSRTLIQLGRQGGPPHTPQASVFGRQVIAGRWHNGSSDLQDFFMSGGVDQRNWLSGTPQGRGVEWISLFRNRSGGNPSTLSFGEIILWDSLLPDEVYLAEIQAMQTKWKAAVAGRNLMSSMY